jgi:hypothetical protein
MADLTITDMCADALIEIMQPERDRPAGAADAAPPLTMIVAGPATIA